MCTVKLCDILKVKNVCVKAVNYVTQYAFSSAAVIIAFYSVLKVECAATASGYTAPAHNDCSHPQMQVKGQAAAYL